MYLAVDDYSSLSVVCPIKAKSDVAGVTMDVIEHAGEAKRLAAAVPWCARNGLRVHQRPRWLPDNRRVPPQTTGGYTPPSSASRMVARRSASTARCWTGCSHGRGCRRPVGGGGNHG